MPWTDADALTHTRKAATPALRRLWAQVANDSRGRGDSDAIAIRKANAAVAKEAGGDEGPHPRREASRWV